VKQDQWVNQALRVYKDLKVSQVRPDQLVFRDNLVQLDPQVQEETKAHGVRMVHQGPSVEMGIQVQGVKQDRWDPWVHPAKMASLENQEHQV